MGSSRIWLVDLAAALPPSVQLDGFDIDIADCPPKEWLPSNVNVSVLDVYGEIPAHLEGLYDVIQLKLFQVVVKNNDPGPLLRNVMKMLSMSGNFPSSGFLFVLKRKNRTHYDRAAFILLTHPPYQSPEATSNG